MHRSPHSFRRPVRLLAALCVACGAGHALPTQAATLCVDSVSEFRAAFDDHPDEPLTVHVVTGTYDFAAGGVDQLVEEDVRVIGGWNAGCTTRQPDPRLTVFTGAGQRFDLLGHESIRVESIAFIGAGRVGLFAGWPGGGGDSALTLERVWLQDVCPNGAPCEDLFESDTALFMTGEHVVLSQVVLTGSGAPDCAARISPIGLGDAFVSFSLITGSDGDGLCVGDTVGDADDDYELFVRNNVFWNNAGDDLVTRESPLITLNNNIYQSWDASPASTIGSTQSLNVDPQFQNAAAHDYRLQASSPAINSGRIGALQWMPQQDLDGGARLIGPAPDRGPLESPSTESTFQVTNTLDSLSPVASGSLRWAIEQANATPGLDRIRFALPGCPRLIDLDAPLPDITDSVFIDGYSQAGSEVNESTFGFAPTICVGVRDPSLTLDHALRIAAGAADDTFLWVSGLAFGGFDVAAVRIAAGSNTWVFGNQFGGSLGGNALGNNSVNVRYGGTSHDNAIGGSEPGQRNLIAHAYRAGIELLDNAAGDDGYGHSVRNNLIGLDGDDALPNALGIRVQIRGNLIEDNTISGNQGDGISLEGALAFGNKIRANVIGRRTFAFCLPPCTPDFALGNVGAGVRLSGAGFDNDIVDNVIAHSGGAGVRLEDGLRNFVFNNTITDNGALGIDVGTAGVNPVYNTGLAGTNNLANRGVNAPVLLTARGQGSNGSVSGQIASRNGLHRVQIFRSASCDASGRGEGGRLMATDTVRVENATLGQNGTANFSIPLPLGLDYTGTQITATLTDGDGNGNSSEFSACLAYETVLCRELFKDGFEDSPPPFQCTPL